MTQDERNNWEETRSQGKKKFILAQGIAFGFIMAVVTGLMSYLMDKDNPEIWNNVLFQSLLWIPFGFLYSFWQWWYNEKQYKK